MCSLLVFNCSSVNVAIDSHYALNRDATNTYNVNVILIAFEIDQSINRTNEYHDVAVSFILIKY